jgi:hypothetical protein
LGQIEILGEKMNINLVITKPPTTDSRVRTRNKPKIDEWKLVNISKYYLLPAFSGFGAKVITMKYKEDICCDLVI